MTVHVRVHQELPASAETAFDVIHDYDRRLEWDTMLRAAYVEGAAAPGRGCVGVCIARPSLGGLAFRFRYTTFRRGEAAAVKLVDAPLPFSSWGAAIRHRDLGPGRSSVDYVMTFTCRPRWAARVVEPVAGLLFRKETERRLRALSAYLLAGRRDGR